MREKQVKLYDPSLTCTIPERFSDEYCTHYKALYMCPAYFTKSTYCIKHPQFSMVEDSPGRPHILQSHTS